MDRDYTMSRTMEAKFDLAEQERADDKRAEPTNHDVVQFIKDFAKCDGDAVMWLEDRGALPAKFRGSNYLIDAEILRNLCRAWGRNSLAVYEVAGVQFWRAMKEMASDALASVD